MQRKYAFLSEKASRPNMFCGSCVIMLEVDLDMPHINFCRRMSILSSLLIICVEYTTVWNPYAIPAQIQSLSYEFFVSW